MFNAHQKNIAQSSQFLYLAPRSVHVTPTNFLDYISSSDKILHKKKFPSANANLA
jgi:hypothetical protein